MDAHLRSIVWDTGDVEEIKKIYSRLVVQDKKRIDDRDVFLIEAAQADGRVDHIYIDCETKLIYRYDFITESVATQQGISFSSQIYFDDYVAINGVQIPMTMRQVQAGVTVTIKFNPAQIRFNVPLEDKTFNKP